MWMLATSLKVRYLCYNLEPKHKAWQIQPSILESIECHPLNLKMIFFSSPGADAKSMLFIMHVCSV